MRVSIVIPVYNALTKARACVDSIFAAGSGYSFEVVVVDNGSEPEVERWLREQERQHANLRHLRDSQPLGFAGAVNRGVAAAAGEVVVVLNSDTLVSAGWLEGLADALAADPSLGAITPCTNHAGEPAQTDVHTTGLEPDAAWEARARVRAAPEVRIVPQRLVFFAVAFRRAVWQALGGLDETYGPGNFEDDDFCLRLRVAGYRLGVARHVFVYHHANATFLANGIEHEYYMRKNEAVFAARARQEALADGPPPRWPKATADVSVIIHEQPDHSLSATLHSLSNQTVDGFEVLTPGTRQAPSRNWIAHVYQGDVLYPFHLEALLDALERNRAEAIFADGWIAARQTRAIHPDGVAPATAAAQTLAGWIHHASLDADRVREEVTPVHWRRLTWEMPEEPAAGIPPPVSLASRAIDRLRQLYRRQVRLETRLAVDAAIRRALGREPAIRDGNSRLLELTSLLEEKRAAGTADASFPHFGTQPAIIQFNAVTWHSATQRQHHFARGLARRGHPVLWVEPELRAPRNWWTGDPPPQVAPGVYLVRLPSGSRRVYHLPWTETEVHAMAAALRLIAAAFGFDEVISLVNYPRWQLVSAHLRETAGWKVVYDCLDDQLAFGDLFQTEVGPHEACLIAQADRLFTSSVILRDRIAGQYQRSATLLHNAADVRLFSSASGGPLRHLPRPIVGFFGVIADWLDFDLIHAAALRFPHFSFVYIGPMSLSRAELQALWFQRTNLPNIKLIPHLDPPALAAHLADFDICTMPFLDIAATRTMNAVKLYEYLAAGKPVVSRSLPEVRHLRDGADGAQDLIALYETPAEFFACLENALATNTPEFTGRRLNFARRHDWSQRVDLLAAALRELQGRGAETRSRE